MAKLNLDAMRQKLAELASKGNKGSENMVKLVEGPQTLRIVPLKDCPESPFQEFLFHYLGNKTYLSPRSYGEVDPIADFSDTLVSAGGLSKDEYKAAKKFSPQLRTYVPVIVRGKENEGIKFWGFGKTTFETIVKIMLDEDYGDITDTEKGHDLKVTFTPAEKSDTKFAKTEITPRPKSSVLSDNPEQINEWLTNQPTLASLFTKHTAESLSEVLSKILNVQAPPAETPASAGVAKDEWAAETPTSVSAVKISADIADEFAKQFDS
jgi:hypothetical protein